MMISLLPKYAVSQVICYIKGKSTIHLFRVFVGYLQLFLSLVCIIKVMSTLTWSSCAEGVESDREASPSSRAEIRAQWRARCLAKPVCLCGNSLFVVSW